MSSADELSNFSYATYFSHPFKRALVRGIEKVSGQPKIKALYKKYRMDLANDEAFWSAAVRLLELDVQYSQAGHNEIPRTGPLVIVANHPFGVLDGVIIAWLTSLVRDDFKILTNSVLLSAPEVEPYLLPVDFAGTRAAMKTNIETRAASLKHLKSGGCVIVFPAGGIATARRPFTTALDDEWKPFTAKMISQSQAHVTPVFFEGQNSNLFQMASHINPALRLSLVFREVRRRMGTAVPVHIGSTLSPDDLVRAGKRGELMTFLRRQTYGLAPPKLRRKIERRDSAEA